MTRVHIRKRVRSLLLATVLFAGFIPAGNLTVWAEAVDSAIRIKESNNVSIEQIEKDEDMSDINSFQKSYQNFEPAGTDVPGLSGGRFYANGMAIKLKDNNGILSAYDASNDRLVSGDDDLTDVVIYAGWESGSHVGNTSIVLDSGIHTASIYGGSREGTLKGDVNIEVEGGEWSTLYGGSAYAETTGDVRITVNGGNPHFIYGGGYEARQKGDVNIQINGGLFYKEYYDSSDQKYYKSYGWIHGGGYYADAVVDGNTSITAADPVLSLDDDQIGHIAGGGFYADVTGDANITVEGRTYGQIYGGGGSPSAGVGGNVNISISNADILYDVYGAGYGSVGGTVTIDLHEDITVGVTSGLTGDIYGGAKYSDDPGLVGSVVINIWGSSIELVGNRQRGVHGGGQCGTVGTAEINVYGSVIYNGESAPVYGGGHSTRDYNGSSEVTGSAVVNVYSVTYDNTKASEQGRADGGGTVKVGMGSEVNYLHYKINEAPGIWADGEITLDSYNDTLTILAIDGPASQTKISVEAPDHSTVTVKGRENRTYKNLSITIEDSDDITLILEDLNIRAGAAEAGLTAAEHGILYNGDNGNALTIETVGSSSIEGGYSAEAQGTAGAGIYSKDGSNTVTIAPSAGNIYIRGGEGPSEQQASIIGDNIYVAAGNIGEIAFHPGAAGRELKNALDGDDVYMLTVFTDPSAPYLTIYSDVTGGFASSYRYNAPADSDGAACMWLPELELDIRAAGYTTEQVLITGDNQAQVTLYAASAAAPRVASVSPGGTGVSRNGNITIAFDMDMDTDTHGTVALNPGSALGGGEWTGSRTYEIPYSGLASSTAYTVEITGFKSEYGVVMLQDTTHGFTTARTSGSSSSGSTNTCTVRFDSNGGSTVNSQSITRNGKAAEPEAPTREGYIFTGWYIDAELTDKYDFDKAVSSSFTLYVGWESAGQGEDEIHEHPVYISGYPDGTFKPDATLTRAEGAALFYNLLDRDIAEGPYAADFEDVSSGAWYYDAVMKLARQGVINGYRDGTFKADTPITRAEFVTIALRFANVAEGGETGFPDVVQTNWASGAIAAAVEAGYVSGYPDGTFQPDRTVTRAEAVTIINRIINCDGITGEGIFSDVPSSHWAYRAINAAAAGHNH